MPKTVWYFAEGGWHQLVPSEGLPTTTTDTGGPTGIFYDTDNAGDWLSIKAGTYDGGDRSNDTEWHIEGDMYAAHYNGDWEMYVGRDFFLSCGASPSETGGDIQMYAVHGSHFDGNIYIHAQGDIEFAMEGRFYIDDLPHGSDPGDGSLWVDGDGFLRQT